MRPLQVRRGSAPTRPSQQGRPKPERLTRPPPNPARRPRADLRGTPEGRLGGGRHRPRIQEKPPAKIPSTPRPSPRSRVTPPPHPRPPIPPHFAPQMCLITKRTNQSGLLLSQNHPPQTSLEGAFCSGSGLADKKHFIVHVEHRFILLFYLFAPFNFHFYLFLFLHYVVVSCCLLAQTTHSLVLLSRRPRGVKVVLWCDAAGPPQCMMGANAYDRRHLAKRLLVC